MTTLKSLGNAIIDLYKKKERELATITSEIEKIENEGIELFKRRAEQMKQELAEDTSVPYEKLDEEYKKRLAELRVSVRDETQAKLDRFQESVRNKIQNGERLI